MAECTLTEKRKGKQVISLECEGACPELTTEKGGKGKKIKGTCEPVVVVVGTVESPRFNFRCACIYRTKEKAECGTVRRKQQRPADIYVCDPEGHEKCPELWDGDQKYVPNCTVIAVPTKTGFEMRCICLYEKGF